jgi:GDP-mannose 6-dehydrogenase
MKISVFGLGYVGSVSAVCLADLGHRVYGVDIVPQKVTTLNEGIPPIHEPQLETLLQKNLNSSRLTFTLNTLEAIQKSDCALIAVGTPSNEQGKVNLVAVERCVESIAGVLADDSTGKDEFLIIIRSTVPPGTVKKLKTLAQNIVGEKCKIHFCMNPEFLREGSAVNDFFNPALIVFGVENTEIQSQLNELYAGINAPVKWVDMKAAELLKYTNNVFHALKISFANEIGRVAEAYGVDGKQIMELVCADTKLNISEKYLLPGFAFGGSCLPKDLRGFTGLAAKKSIDIPVIQSIIPSNDAQIDQYAQQILESNSNKVSFLGITFKSGTDDVRESPTLRLIREVIVQNINVKILDVNIHPRKVMGANRRYFDEILPDWQDYYASSVEQLFQYSDTIVLTNNEPAHEAWVKQFGSKKHILRLF